MTIHFKDVTYIYNKGAPMEKTAIRGLSLSVNSGEFVVVMGSPGSGKSTFLQLLSGILKPALGRITFASNNSKQSDKIMESSVGLVFQFPERQFFEDSVYSDLSFPLRRAGMREDEIEARVKEALGAVDIDFSTYKDRPPIDLSTGEKRRVSIAGILVLNPEVIALDEPLAGLDGKGKREIVKELKRLQREKGKTVVVSTQDRESFSRVYDRVILLENGALVGDGRANLINDMFSGASQLQRVVDILKGKGLDFGHGVIDVEEAFSRIKKVGLKRCGKT